MMLSRNDEFSKRVATATIDEIDFKRPVTFYCTHLQMHQRKTPSGKTVAIIYGPNQEPTVYVQLQEMFGQIESPAITMCSVTLRFELLSPACMLIQTTSDLGTFRKTSYFDVAKDMKSRYPKRRWPDKPLLGEAGAID